MLACRNGSHVAAYEDGLKGRMDGNKKLTKHHQVTRDEFISHKLAPKLAQQLKVSPHVLTLLLMLVDTQACCTHSMQFTGACIWQDVLVLCVVPLCFDIISNTVATDMPRPAESLQRDAACQSYISECTILMSDHADTYSTLHAHGMTGPSAPHLLLQDVLAICGNALPSWCSQLVFSCKFLFPFDVRRRYFYCTSFSLARALHHLQQQQNAEGGNAPSTDREVRELRVGRLQRQKVHFKAASLCLLQFYLVMWHGWFELAS